MLKSPRRKNDLAEAKETADVAAKKEEDAEDVLKAEEEIEDEKMTAEKEGTLVTEGTEITATGQTPLVSEEDERNN